VVREAKRRRRRFRFFKAKCTVRLRNFYRGYLFSVVGCRQYSSRLHFCGFCFQGRGLFAIVETIRPEPKANQITRTYINPYGTAVNATGRILRARNSNQENRGFSGVLPTSGKQKIR